MANVRIELDAFLNVTPIDTALREIFKLRGLEFLGGKSGRGWSSRAAFMKCPYYYNAIRQGELGRSVALEVGILFHVLLALFYAERMEVKGYEGIEPDELRLQLTEQGCSGEVIMEAYRLYTAYTFRYEDDYLTPLAVEHREESKQGDTCRYDLIANVGPNALGLPEGTWIVEHKSASRMDDATLDGWRSDGEIIGQEMLWKRNRLDRVFGELQGVIVNLAFKTRVVDFRRVLVPVLPAQLRQHSRDLKVFDAFERVCEATGVWPRSRHSCIGRYGKCSLFEHCASGGSK